MKANSTDAFFIHPFGTVAWIRYNTDCEADEQFIYNVVGIGDIESAADTCHTTDAFFNYLESVARQSVYDSGTNDFDSTEEEFMESPDFTGLTEDTMNVLIEVMRKDIEETAKYDAAHLGIEYKEPATKAKPKTKTLYLVYEVNCFIPDCETVDESFMKLFSNKEKAVAHAESLRDYYIKECSDMFTYLPEDSVEGSDYAFAYHLANDGVSSEGCFDIIVTELPAPDDE